MTNKGLALPNFFVVGAGKAGTTSLYHYLRQHPQIFMSPVKEPSFFASEIRIENLSVEFKRHVRKQSSDRKRWLISDWDDYVHLFDGVQNEVAVGEATPSYLWSATAAFNIRARVPGARIVMILRDPAERAYSHYLHLVAEGLTRSSFGAHIAQCMRAGTREIGVCYPFLEIGLYCEQVKRYLDLFPMEHVRVDWYEEAWRAPHEFLKDLSGFLGVDPTWQPDVSRRSLERRTPRLATVRYLLKKTGLLQPLQQMIPPKLRPSFRALAFRTAPPPPMASRDRQHLVDYYREDIQKLASLLDRDLQAWLR